MGNYRTQSSGESRWRNGFCSNIGSRAKSYGSFRDSPSSYLRIGVGDSARGSNDRLDWTLFMPLQGNGRGDYSGARIWSFGSEYRMNTGYNGMVYIHGNAVTKHSYYTLFNGIGGLATHKNTHGPAGTAAPPRTTPKRP